MEILRKTLLPTPLSSSIDSLTALLQPVASLTSRSQFHISSIPAILPCSLLPRSILILIFGRYLLCYVKAIAEVDGTFCCSCCGQLNTSGETASTKPRAIKQGPTISLSGATPDPFVHCRAFQNFVFDTGAILKALAW